MGIRRSVYVFYRDLVLFGFGIPVSWMDARFFPQLWWLWCARQSMRRLHGWTNLILLRGRQGQPPRRQRRREPMPIAHEPISPCVFSSYIPTSYPARILTLRCRQNTMAYPITLMPELVDGRAWRVHGECSSVLIIRKNERVHEKFESGL